MEIFLTIVLAIFLLMWLLIRLIPLLISRWINKKMGTAKSQREQKSRRDGEVYISKVDENNSEKIVEKDMGEYVDYETIKEDK